jgi:UDP-N-acetylmuramoyl-tripeptide--D-alanyl-D-alanine ligase
VAVIEMGMNHRGETAELAALARPTTGLVNNAQREHQAFMRGVEEVAVEHGALIIALPEDGVAVLNADDAFAEIWRRVAGNRKTIDFGLDHPAAVTGSATESESGTELFFRTPTGEARTRLQTLGRHNVINALAAVAVATAVGLDAESVARGLAEFRPVKGRLQLKHGVRGCVVIDDSYNANPDSVRAAIEVLASTAGRTVLVLGDMAEVGARGAEYHEEVGLYARERGIDRLLACGEATRATVRAFGREDDHHSSTDSLAAAARALDSPGTTILVKGSRFMRMDQIVQQLMAS